MIPRARVARCRVGALQEVGRRAERMPASAGRRRLASSLKRWLAPRTPPRAGRVPAGRLSPSAPTAARGTGRAWRACDERPSSSPSPSAHGERQDDARCGRWPHRRPDRRESGNPTERAPGSPHRRPEDADSLWPCGSSVIVICAVGSRCRNPNLLRTPAVTGRAIDRRAARVAAEASRTAPRDPAKAGIPRHRGPGRTLARPAEVRVPTEEGCDPAGMPVGRQRRIPR